MIKSISIALLLLCNLPLIAGPRNKPMKNPDFTKGDSMPDVTGLHDWNLGATGMRGWMYSDKLVTTDARQIKITKVAAGSPAEGKIAVGDVLLGVAGKSFSEDPRMEMGKALTSAESKNGILILKVWKSGKAQTIKLKLSVLGSYSATAPYKCLKSKKIFMRGCNALAKRIARGEKRKHPITRALNGLALLASGNSEYYPLLEKEAQWASQVKPVGYYSWSYSYVIMFLAEYTMATGDKTFLPDLERLALEVANGASLVGSWGHKFVAPDGILNGYGMMNATSTPLAISLFLAHKAGITDPKIMEVVKKNARLNKFYTGKGSVPYGDHNPYALTHEDNGKCGMAAVLLDYLGEKEAATFFSKMSVASHGSERDTGHTGNFLNILWAMPGVAKSGPVATGAWMKEFGASYYDLARQWDGNFLFQGAPQKQIRSYKGWDCTGVYLLAYAMPLKNIYLTGRGKGVVDHIDKKEAMMLIEDGRGWTNKDRLSHYRAMDKGMLIKRLGSWSPIVRNRVVEAMDKAKMGSSVVSELIDLLKSSSINTKIGACQALAKFNDVSAVRPLREALKSDDLWLRVKAAEALAAIGEPATSALPELLKLVSKSPSKNDPRGMEQRFLGFLIFNKFLKKSLDGVDKKLLTEAIIACLRNEDGNVRGKTANIFNLLTYDEIKPLLPNILKAIQQPAPSGIMFSSTVRIKGVEILAKHKIKEGMELCFDALAINKWGKGNRIGRCLNIWAKYGGAAKPILPKLRELEMYLVKGNKKGQWQRHVNKIQGLIKNIESATKIPEMRSIHAK